MNSLVLSGSRVLGTRLFGPRLFGQGIQNRQSNLVSYVSLTLAAVAFILVTGYALSRYLETLNNPLRITSQPKAWIRAPGDLSHAGYFRKRFDLPCEVRHAWVKIAATDGYEISVNRNPLGRIYVVRPTRPFQSGNSRNGQVLLPQDPALSLNFPRDYQWDGHDDWRLPSYVELTSSLHPGKNVISVEVESRTAPARVAFEGQIELWNGEMIPIQSDETWLAEPAIPGPQLLDWTELYYWDKEWRNAIQVDGPATLGYRSHPKEIYTRNFDGKWFRHPTASSMSAITYYADWKIDQPINEAYIRLLTNRSYELHINGTRVRVASEAPPDLDNGNWVLGRGAAHDPTSKPELLDTDEVSSSFVGTRFESPRKADSAFPERPIPNALKHDSATGGFLSYSIANLLHPGSNRIEVRCLKKEDANWLTQIAIDGGGTTSTGQPIQFLDEGQWYAKLASSEESGNQNGTQVQVLGPVASSGIRLPSMQYRGVALHPEQFDKLLPKTLGRVTGFVAIALTLILVTSYSLDLGRKGIEPSSELSLLVSTCQKLYAVLLTATVTIGSGLLLECAWLERHENLWFIDGSMWAILFPVAIVAAFAVALADTVGRIGTKNLRARGHSITARLRDLPQSRFWFHLILWVLLLGALARGYKLDLQPLDDDEYASTQAVLAIMETGAPGFVPEDVYYTRSPFYHYITALIALPFGGDLWTLRLQTIGWSVATALLTYFCGSRLMGSKWVGMMSMLLVCVHPFEIFTGHVIRFYQIQQFFALLTMYCFCRGFVTDQSQNYRVATLIVFLVAVVSQEISIAIAPSIIFGYLVFAKDLGWQKNITLILLSMIVVVLIGLDFIVFQTLCLTRTEGVSPSIEAAVKPHFWYPMNMLSIFIGYSRLHVVPSFFLFAGLPLLWREQNRNTLSLLSMLVSGVVMTNILVTNVSLRYMYWLFPVWILLSVDGMRLVLSTLVSLVYPPDRNLNRYVATLAVCCFMCLASILASWSLWRIPGSYEMRILGDSTGAVRWVRSQKRPGDRIAITEPHTHCAYLEGDKCDYDLAFPLLYDFAVMRNGVLVDRNGGGEVISNIDQMIREFSEGNRIWVLLNREKFRTRGKNMRWEYPGARFETFIRKNCELKHRTYLWSVYLWDPAAGHYQNFRLQE